MSCGIDSTVQTKYLGDFGIIFSSPVIRATFSAPTLFTHLSKISLANNLNGKPMAQLMLRENCTVTIVHSKTKNIKQECLKAEILIAAAGVPKLVKEDWIQKNCIVIDVGINNLDGKIVGDTDYDNIKNHVKAITPVPGGVGPMTIACLLQNTLACFKKSNY